MLMTTTTNTAPTAAIHTDIILCETREGVRTSLGAETLVCGERFTVVDSYCVSDSDRCIVLASMGIRVMAWITLGTRAGADGEYTIRIGSQSDKHNIKVKAA